MQDETVTLPTTLDRKSPICYCVMQQVFTAGGPLTDCRRVRLSSVTTGEPPVAATSGPLALLSVVRQQASSGLRVRKGGSKCEL